MKIIDSHMHCGVQNVSLPFETVIDIFHRRKKTGAVDAALPEIALDRFKRQYKFDTQAPFIFCRKSALTYQKTFPYTSNPVKQVLIKENYSGG